MNDRNSLKFRVSEVLAKGTGNEKTPESQELLALIKDLWSELESVENQKSAEVNPLPDVSFVSFEKYTGILYRALQNLSSDYRQNINIITSLFGQFYGATCALYNRLEEGMLCSVGQWATPPGYKEVDSPEGHLCYDVIKNGSENALYVSRLPETIYNETDPNVKLYNLQTYVGRAVFCEGKAVGSLCLVFQNDFIPDDAFYHVMDIFAAALGLEELRLSEVKRHLETEERLRVLINSTPDAICFKDENGKWLQANESILRLYNLQDVDYRFKSDSELAEFTHDIYKEAFNNCNKSDEVAWQAGTLSRTEEVTPDIHGFQHVFDVIKVPLYNEDGSRKGLVVFGRDITRRVDAEKETNFLNESALDFLQMSDNDDIFKYIVDKVHTLAGDCIVMATSFDETTQEATLRALTGLGKFTEKALSLINQNPIGMKTYIDPIRKKDVLIQSLTTRKDLYEMLNGALSRPICFALENLLQIGKIYEMGFAGKDILLGDVTIILPKNRLLKNKGVIEAFIKVAAVALHQRFVKSELIKSEESYRGLFDCITGAVYIQDENGIFLDVNQGAVNMYGYPKETFLGNTPAFLSAPGKNDHINLSAILSKTLHGEPQQIEFWGRRSNGEIFPKEVRFYKGNYFGKTVVLVLAIDITDRYNMISEIIANKEKAEESDRLKTAFLHNISHEIRTPMNGIVGFSALITQPGLPSKEVEEYFGIINDCSNQLLAIINDIVSIATLEAGQEKLRESNMNLNKAIQLAVLQHHGKAIEKGLNLYYTFGLVDDSAEIIADETKLTQVLNNLISNGIKFTSSGSVHVGYSVDNKAIKLFVKDTGLGIAPEMHDLIFDRFRQVNHALSMNTGGTGLGLSISKSYIELMGGRIWLESEPGIGSTFYIELPFKQSLRRFSGNDNKREEINGEFLNGKTIVVAEDEEYNFRLIKGMLSGYGPNLVHLINGQQAVDYCKANQAVDVILMDLKMAVMDGFEASEIIRKIKPGLPIIAQSALALIGDREKALNAGCSDYIAKPLRKEQLLILLKKHLG